MTHIWCDELRDRKDLEFLPIIYEEKVVGYTKWKENKLWAVIQTGKFKND